jgi:hypothetical protein
MTEQTTLQAFIASLRRNAKPPAITDPTVTGISIELSVAPGYVWPNLRSPVVRDGSRIAIIEAPGAVGKSSAAQAIAASLRWPKVDASQAQVGSYSLSGLLQDALGLNSSYISDIVTGNGGIIIDALDEARLKAGSANFRAFLDNIRKMSGAPGPTGVTMILLSRPDTSAIVKSYLESHSCPYTEASLDFFSRDQALRYIDAYMTAMDAKYPGRHYDVSRRFRAAFEALRDSQIVAMCQALLSEPDAKPEKDWERIASFLGYAPVLAVLSAYLAVPNPHAALQSATLGNNPKSVLLGVINDILVREQEKFLGQVKYKLRAELPADVTWDRFDTLYAPEEQCVRLAERLIEIPMVVDLPADVPLSLRASYDKHAKQFMADHPFMAGSDAVNVVFADFIKAKASIDPVCLACLGVDPRGSIYAPGPFYYQFVSEFSVSDVENDDPVLPEVLVSVVLDSQAQTASAEDRNLVRYYQRDGEAYLILVDTFAADDDNAIVFRIGNPSGAIQFVARLSRCIVSTDEAIIFGTRNSRFTLGPYALVGAGEVVIDADTLSIDTSGLEDPGLSVILADRFSIAGPLTIDAPVPEALAVDSANAWPVLRPYLRQAPSFPQLLDLGSYMDLRAVIRAFRQRAGSAPSVYEELMDQRVVKTNQRRRDYLDRLVQLGVVDRKNKHYYLSTDELSKFGVDWGALTSGEPSAAVKSLIGRLESSEA